MNRLHASLLLLLLASTVGGAPSLEVAANRKRIYLGESLHLTVTVQDARHAPQPDVSALKNCDIEFLGSHYRSLLTLRERHHYRVFAYKITPRESGEFQAGPITVRLDNETLKDEGPTISVEGMQKQDRVLVRLSATRESVLVNEPFEITLSVSIRRLPPPHEDIEPLPLNNPPSLTASYLDKQEIEGLQTPNVQNILQGYLVQNDQPGFTINDYTVERDPFDMANPFDFDGFLRRDKARLRFHREPTTINGLPYFTYALTLPYAPVELGSHTFGPVVFRGEVLTSIDDEGRVSRRPIFAVGPAVTVRIVPPPEEGRPASYVEAIGSNLTATASLDMQTCNVGDPLQLTIRLSGHANMEDVIPPPIATQTNLTDSFRIYEDTVQTETAPESKIYTYTIRPITPGTLEVPPIEISYYDIVSRKYKTIYTEPIPVRAREVAQLQENVIVGAWTNAVGRSNKPKASSLIIAPLNVDPAGAVGRSLGLRRSHGILLLCGPAIFLLGVIIRAVRKALLLHSPLASRKQLFLKGKTRIIEAHRLSEKDPGAARRHIFLGLRDCIAAFLDVAAEGLTPRDMAGYLRERLVAQETVAALFGILDRNFNAAYAPPEVGDPALVEDIAAAEQLIRDLERRWKGRRNGRSVPS